jgi:prepilin-type N-terminal cleavage/methylation domain-containing protein
MKTKGFTLLELLIVVAILVMIIAIVMTNLSANKSKAANAGVKSNAHTISQQAEIYYMSNGSTYGNAFAFGQCAQTAGTLFADTTLWRALQEMERQSGSTATCVSTSAAWAVAVPLKVAEGSNTHWCIDSQGKAKGTPGNITTTACQ